MTGAFAGAYTTDTMPGRSTGATSPVASTTVDSMPTAHAPPSKISKSSTKSPSESATCRAVVGETPSERFALGAATGTPLRRKSSSGDRMVGDAKRNRVAARRHKRRHGVCSSHHERHRARPVHRGKFGGERCPIGAQQFRGVRVDDMNNERVGCRATFRRENTGDGFGIQRVRAQAIYGFGRKRDQLSPACKRATASAMPSVAATIRVAIGVFYRACGCSMGKS